VFEAEGINRRFYELCVLSEMSNALRSGDLWVVGSRQFKDFDEYLLTADIFAQIRYIRDETYTKARAQIVNYHHELAFAAIFGQGATSSSDAQRFRAGGRGEATGRINPRYGHEPGALFYTHVSDQYAPFYSQVINATARDATYVLDGLLYHETDLQIEEHSVDATGKTAVYKEGHLYGLPRVSVAVISAQMWRTISS
jgi:hypothetical protein